MLGVFFLSGLFALRGEIGVGQQGVDLLQGPGIGPVVTLVERLAGIEGGVGAGVGRGIPKGVQVPLIGQADRIAAGVAVRVGRRVERHGEKAAVACSG